MDPAPRYLAPSTDLIAKWREGGNNLFAFGFATVVGLSGFIALIVGAQYSPSLSGGGLVLLLLIDLAILIPFGTVFYGELTRGGTRLYSDRLEVHNTLWPWSSTVYWLSDLAGAGLYLHDRVMPVPNTGGRGDYLRWQAAFWRSATEASNESSIEMVHDIGIGHSVARKYAKGEDPIKASRAGRIITATYEQALKCQGAGGPASSRLLPSKEGEAQIADGDALLARWTPWSGYQELGSDNETDPNGTSPPTSVFKGPPGSVD